MTNIYIIDLEIETLLEHYYSCFDETWELVIPEEDFREIEKELEALQNKKSELLEWLLKSRANNLSNITWIEAEIKRLSEMKARFEKKVNKTELFIEKLVKPNYQWKTINYGLFSVGFRKSKAVLLSEDFEDTRYRVEKISYSYDKTAIKKDLEAGKEIKGAMIEERQNLFIK